MQGLQEGTSWSVFLIACLLDINNLIDICPLICWLMNYILWYTGFSAYTPRVDIAPSESFILSNIDFSGPNSISQTFLCLLSSVIPSLKGFKLVCEKNISRDAPTCSFVMSCMQIVIDWSGLFNICGFVQAISLLLSSILTFCFLSLFSAT